MAALAALTALAVIWSLSRNPMITMGADPGSHKRIIFGQLVLEFADGLYPLLETVLS